MAVVACTEVVTSAAGQALCVTDTLPVSFDVQLDADTLVTGYALGAAVVLLPWLLGYAVGVMDRILRTVGGR